jgi:hypothetical protein
VADTEVSGQSDIEAIAPLRRPDDMTSRAGAAATSGQRLPLGGQEFLGRE